VALSARLAYLADRGGSYADDRRAALGDLYAVRGGTCGGSLVRMAARPVRMALVKRSKYRAVKETVDGITFASKAEARRYAELKLLEKAGVIRDLRLQPEFVLCPLMMNMQIVPLGKYRGDFAYEQHDDMTDEWVTIVEDVKGFKTPLYRWKKKHVEAQYGITIREIR